VIATARRVSLAVRLRGLVVRHPDLVCLGLVLGLALLVRGQFVFRAPMFMQHDSLGYFLPAHDLVTGQGFGVGFRRTPIYPLLLSLVMLAMGVSLAAVLIAQHLLGALTAALAYWLGRDTFGRAAGLFAGLLTALNGALIIGEHYLMSEAVFIPLLLAALLALLRAGRQPTAVRLVLAGLLLGLAAMSRPIGQALYPLVPVALLLAGAGIRATVRGTLLAALGVLLVVAPWTARNCLTAGECSTTGVVGQALLARTAYYDKGFVFFDPQDPDRGPNAPRPNIRAAIQRYSNQDFSGGVITRRLQDDFKWTDAETARIAREMALDVIRRQPLYYLNGTLEMFGRIALAEPERLRTDWKTQGRRESRGEWPERARWVLASPTDQQEQEFARAELMVNLWQPAFWAPWWPLLGLAGLGLALAGASRRRGAALLGFAALILMLVAAALDGPVSRYRYPADPLIAVLGAGCLCFATSWCWRRLRQVSRPRPRPVEVISASSEALPLEAARQSR
jgi:4-amino-4-deoxy-L-arabinose transferase-like glycosyltransferase